MYLLIVDNNFALSSSLPEGVLSLVHGSAQGERDPATDQFLWYDSDARVLMAQTIEAYPPAWYEEGITDWSQLNGYIYITPYDAQGEETWPFRTYSVNPTQSVDWVGLSVSDFQSLHTSNSLTRPTMLSGTFSLPSKFNSTTINLNVSLNANTVYMCIMMFYYQIENEGSGVTNYDHRSIPYITLDVANSNYVSPVRGVYITSNWHTESYLFAFSLNTAGRVSVTIRKQIDNTFLPNGATSADNTNVLQNNRGISNLWFIIPCLNIHVN